MRMVDLIEKRGTETNYQRKKSTILLRIIRVVTFLIIKSAHC